MHKLGENILFIVGSPRSGTTWLQKILGSHPSVVTAQESELFTSFIGPSIRHFDSQLNSPSGRGGTGLPCYLTTEQFEALMREFFYRVVSRVKDYSDKKLFVEKTPSHALVIDVVHRVLPAARFIHIVRDPRDVAASMIAASKSWGSNWAPKNIFSAARMWGHHVRSAEKKLGFVQERQKLTLRYEDLKAAIFDKTKEILDFVGLDAQDKIVNSIIKGSETFQLKKYGEFAKISGETVGDPKDFVRKGTTGGWRKDIGIVRGAILFLLCQPEMKMYGYKW